MIGLRWRKHRVALAPWLLLALAIALVAVQLKRPAALWDLYRPWAEIGALATVMTAVILTGGIDLSIGSTLALAGVVLGLLWHDAGWPLWAATAAALLTGTAAGACNGLLIVQGIAPLVATLATMACYSGLAMALCEGRRISGLPVEFCRLGQGFFLGLSGQFWLLAIIVVATATAVHRTPWGRGLYAIGDNRLAAQFAAVPVRRVEMLLYTACGLAAGAVAVFYTARGGAAVPDAGVGIELKAIACVVIGGTRVTGGYGSVARTLLGLAVMAHLDLGLQLLGARRIGLPFCDATWQVNANARQILLGALVIALAIWNQRVTSGERDERRRFE